MLTFYFTQVEFSVIEISRMRRQVEKVAGLWDVLGAGVSLPLIDCIMVRHGTTGLIQNRPALQSEVSWVSPTNPVTGASLLPGNTSLDSLDTWIGGVPASLKPVFGLCCRCTKRKWETHPDDALDPLGCCQHPAVRHRTQGGKTLPDPIMA